VKANRQGSTIKLAQERFTVNFPNPPALQWQVPLTYVTQDQPATNGFLLRDSAADLPNELPPDRRSNSTFQIPAITESNMTTPRGNCLASRSIASPRRTE
jgi:hypothetical protein